jgi:hypothetical protein
VFCVKLAVEASGVNWILRKAFSCSLSGICDTKLVPLSEGPKASLSNVGDGAANNN